MTKIDVSTCDEGTKKIAEIFYRRYCENADNKNFQGNECPAWEALPPAVQSHWCAVGALSTKGAMAVIKEFVTSKLDAMATRPAMYAMSNASFLEQIALLAEMRLHTLPEMTSGVSRVSELTRRIWGRGAGPGAVDAQKPIDPAWAKAAVATTKAFLEEKCPTS